jgi:hypothetical protein
MSSLSNHVAACCMRGKVILLTTTTCHCIDMETCLLTQPEHMSSSWLRAHLVLLNTTVPFKSFPADQKHIISCSRGKCVFLPDRDDPVCTAVHGTEGGLAPHLPRVHVSRSGPRPVGPSRTCLYVEVEVDPDKVQVIATSSVLELPSRRPF